MSGFDLGQLQELVRSGAAARSRTTLQPAGGEGTKVFPPTYSGSVYAIEKRRLPGHDEPVDCVLLDSVQSQANRLEEALQQAIDEGRITLPLIEVDFTPFYPGKDKEETLRLLDPIGKVTSLQAPHRIADAILRDSIVVEENRPFRAQNEDQESSYGQRLRRVTAQNATTLLELCPTALLLGMWDSTGPKGGLGAKFERVLVSEIVGINVITGVRSSSRIDPLAIQLEAGPIYRAKDSEPFSWTLDPSKAKHEKGAPAKFAKDGKPSEINHGNIKPDLKDKKGQPFHGGVTITSAEQTVVLSFPALRRLRFPVNGEANSRPEVDLAARTLLAALGLCAAALAAEAGMDLRSRCLLWPTEPMTWELLGKPGQKVDAVTMEADDAVKLLKEAVAAAKKVGLPWREEPLRLVPSDDLVRLVVKSQQLAASQTGGEE